MTLCLGCPPIGYPTDKTRCTPCPRRTPDLDCPRCRGGGCEWCSNTGRIQDCRPDNGGLDDGPELHPVRKKPEPKPPEVTADIRARAWATRREKYGKYGHR
jgi:hypothetical protein